VHWGQGRSGATTVEAVGQCPLGAAAVEMEGQGPMSAAETATSCGGGVPMETTGGGARPGNGTQWIRRADVVGENGKPRGGKMGRGRREKKRSQVVFKSTYVR
jgi:hypothetical protein